MSERHTASPLSVYRLQDYRSRGGKYEAVKMTPSEDLPSPEAKLRTQSPASPGHITHHWALVCPTVASQISFGGRAVAKSPNSAEPQVASRGHTRLKHSRPHDAACGRFHSPKPRRKWSVMSRLQTQHSPHQ